MAVKFLTNTFFRLLVFFFIIICVAVYGLYVYNRNLEENLAAAANETLSEIIIQQKFNFKTEINSELLALKSLTVLLEHHPAGKDPVLSTMRELIDKTNFEYITIANTKGMALTSSDQIINVSRSESFLNAMKGLVVLGEPTKSQIRDAFVIPLAAPIYVNGKVSGVLIGSYNVNRLNALLLPSFSGKGQALVINGNGLIIADTANAGFTAENDFFNFLGGVTFDNSDTYSSILTNISQGKTGKISYHAEKETYLAQYEPLGINNWYIFAVIPEKIIAANAAAITGKAALLTLITVFGFTLFVTYVLLQQIKSDKMKQNYLSQLERMAYIDELTGFNNFNRFSQIATDILRDNPHKRFLFSKFDVNGFTLLNEQFGFEEGDRILKNTAVALDSILAGKIGTFCRVHADEFVFMCFCTEDTDAEIMRVCFEKKFSQLMSGGYQFFIQFPTGRYFSLAGENDIRQIFEKVNYAHRIAKLSPEKNICVYDHSMMKTALYEKELESKMALALQTSDFKLFLQPKYRLDNETVIGAEALVRWRYTDGTLVNPGVFIPLFEKNGFITRLDMYMFENTCKLIKNWIETGKKTVAVSVNFSRLHLLNPDFVSEIRAIADLYNVPRKYLEIELTESTIHKNETILENVLRELHEAGFSLSMDDFGTGYSSLGLLKNLPVDVIKFDRTFFINATSQARARTVIANIMRMARELSIYTVAEGVETREYIDFLRDLGCDSVQGYYFAAPMPADEFSA